MGANLLHRIERLGEDPADSIELRAQKRVLILVSVMVATLAIAWGAVYFVLEEQLAAAIPWTYTVAVLVSLIFFRVSRRYAFFRVSRRYAVFRFIQLLLILLLPFLLQLVLGGFVNASAVIIWSLLAPLGALTMVGRRQATVWFIAYASLVAFAYLLQPSLQIENNLPPAVIAGFFIANIVASTSVAFYALHYFVGQKDEALELLDQERDRSERLLLNVLPAEIAEQLKEGDQAIATRHSAATVLFADLVGFTGLSYQLEADEIVKLLNDIFSYFDSLVDRYGLEKIRTIGDAYMVASGVPTSRPDHARVMARMALDMFDYVPGSSLATTAPLQFRIGISSGPVVAGVIGRAKFQYDVWGETVNMASRMEQHGIPGRIQLNATTRRLLDGEFDLEPRGFVDVKGMGSVETWFLVGAAPER